MLAAGRAKNYYTMKFGTGMFHYSLISSLLALLLGLGAGQNEEERQKEEFFESRVRPLLSTNCYTCHTHEQKGGLRLDSRRGMLKGGSRGPAVVPGKPEESLLIQAVTQDHETLRMPPPGKLSGEYIDDLIKWVKDGAYWPEAAAANEYLIRPEQQAFWSFQLPRKPPLPQVRLQNWARTPLDYFILARLEEKGLKPAPLAPKRTLIRRASYDLTGLPPSPEEVEEFLADRSPNAFARVVDRLLASPHYGERWGRHWLDLVRYADTAGDSSDYPIPQAYLYRDYVVDSLNRDKPYDQFMREQIAGDLLPGRTEQDQWERVIATGYLAISRRFSVRPERNMHLTIEDTIDNLGKVFLGLSVSCARCHDHKYDPISTQDYYALYGIFDSTRYPFAGSENVQYQQDLITRLAPSQVDEIVKPFQGELDGIEAQIKRLEEERRAVLAEIDRGQIPARRPDEIRAEIRKLEKARKSIRAKMPELEMAFAVAEGEPHNARIQLRGDPRSLGEEVPRRFLQVLGGRELPAWARGSGRLQLAEWLTDPQNPLPGRVMVNRLWQHHFGKGIVATPSDFGVRGERPSHPELLDYLAVGFRESGWSLKAMHRLIMLSQSYQMASQGDHRNAELDPQNRFLWKFNRRRLDPEAIRDSLLLFSGELDPAPGGPHPFPDRSTWAFTQHRPYHDVYESRRRSVYLMTQRIQKHPYLAIFDGADTNLSTAERLVTTTPIQALFMMNSEFVHQRAEQFARHLIAGAGESRARIDRAHRIVLGHPVTSEELRKGLDFLKRAREKLKESGVPATDREWQALAGYVRVLFSGNEFIFVD